METIGKNTSVMNIRPNPAQKRWRYQMVNISDSGQYHPFGRSDPLKPGKKSAQHKEKLAT